MKSDWNCPLCGKPCSSLKSVWFKTEAGNDIKIPVCDSCGDKQLAKEMSKENK